MPSLPANKQARRLKAACTLLLVAASAYLLHRANYYTLDLIYTSKYTFAEHPLWLHGLRALLIATAAVTPPIAMILLSRSRLFRTYHQRIALYILIPCALLIASDALLLRWENIYTAWHFQHITDNYIRTDHSLRSRLFTKNSRTIFAIAHLLLAALALLLILPPQVQLKAWHAKHQRTLRNFAGAILMFFAIAACQRLCVVVFNQQITDAFTGRGPKTFPYYFTEYGWLPNSILFDIAVLAGALWLMRIRSQILQLTKDPNRCASCAYPLDAHMTACPECGSQIKTSEPAHTP